MRLLATTVAVQTALIFVQSITAGLRMTLPYGHVFHSAGSYALWVVTVAHVVVALLTRRAQAVWYALGFLALMTAQVFLGLFHLVALHVPLAAALLVASLLYLLRIRSNRHHSSHPQRVAAEYR